MQAMTVKEEYVATNVAVNIALRIHMMNYMCTVKSQMFGMGELIITLDAILRNTPRSSQLRGGLRPINQKLTSSEVPPF